jgi:restriction system protein
VRGVLANRRRTADTPNLAAQGQSVSRKTVAEVPLTGLSLDQTDFGQDFTIFEEDGDQVGKQYETDAGRIDILAVSKDKKRLLVIELKRGRTSDVVVGQLLRYMGYVKEELAESGQAVEGVVIGLEDDQKLRWAIAPVPAVKFYRYQINFKLIGG